MDVPVSILRERLKKIAISWSGNSTTYRSALWLETPSREFSTAAGDYTNYSRDYATAESES
jgi:hypothetical protein